jgi:hypothetical protein
VPTAWNIFRIGRVHGAEDQLTEMLVWLADAVPSVRGALLRLAFGEAALTDQAVEITTQHGVAVGRFDAFLVSADVALVVESKLGTDYGPGQIRKYLEWLVGEFGGSKTCGLMTLTARDAPWPDADRMYAAAAGVVSAARRWEDFHGELGGPDASDLSGRLVTEFLDMLAAEGLIPVQPLNEEELATAWADGWGTVRRYRDFFHACKQHIGEELGAELLPNSWSDRGDWVWQDYMLPEGARLVVGLFCTDEHEPIPRHAHTRSPIVWMAMKADHLENGAEVTRRLEQNPPDGWMVGQRWYGERPNISRPLAPLLVGRPFEEQRQALALAVSAATSWLAAATLGLAATDPS